MLSSTSFLILANYFQPLVGGLAQHGDLQLKPSIVFITFLSIFSTNALASTQEEINHLLNFIATTDCTYERNGSMHNAAEAVKHINKKYEHFSDDIQTTEDFIKYSATKSKMSGKYYKIHCSNNIPVKSQEWLLAELVVYRQAQK